MSYPNFGNVKTLTLPIPTADGGLTIAQYKEKYGIDLKDVLVVTSNGAMQLKYNGLILLSDVENNLYDSFVAYGQHSTFPVSAFNTTDYAYGNSDGYLDIGCLDVIGGGVVTGIRFDLPKDKPVSYDSVIILPTGN